MQKRIALLSDIHGNITALDAVLKDAEHEMCEDFWVLGDVVMQGPGASEVFDKLETHSPSVWVKGNWDDILLAVAAKEDCDFDDPTDVYCAKMATDIVSRMTDKNLNKLKLLPMNSTQEVNGVTIAVSHHLPEKNYGRDLLPTNEQSNFDLLIDSDKVDIGVYGHVHHQLMRYTSSEQLIINPGSVGFPELARKQLWKSGSAHYAILDIDETGLYQVYFKQVKYDVEEEIAFAFQVNYPYMDIYKEQLLENITRAHDKEYLQETNERYGYQEDVRAYFEK